MVDLSKKIMKILHKKSCIKKQQNNNNHQRLTRMN